MTDVKQYVLTHDFSYEIVVEVDHDVLTDEKLCELMRFRGDGESRIERHGALMAFLKLFAARFMAESVSSEEPANAFNEGRIDGFPAIGEDNGLRVVAYTSLSFDAEDFDVLEI